jgi:hypothetical protein
MSEEQTNFKVTDRRLFNADGTPRQVEVEREDQPKVVEEVISNPATSGVRTEASEAANAQPQETEDGYEHLEEDEDVNNPASFINFLMTIASNAAAALGIMEHPVTGLRSVDLAASKHWIDILAMLQQKTRGNLSPNEQRTLEGLLADMRMQFVSLTTPQQAKSKWSGRDITGGR